MNNELLKGVTGTNVLGQTAQVSKKVKGLINIKFRGTLGNSIFRLIRLIGDSEDAFIKIPSGDISMKFNIYTVEQSYNWGSTPSPQQIKQDIIIDGGTPDFQNIFNVFVGTNECDSVNNNKGTLSGIFSGTISNRLEFRIFDSTLPTGRTQCIWNDEYEFTIKGNFSLSNCIIDLDYAAGRFDSFTVSET